MKPVQNITIAAAIIVGSIQAAGASFGIGAGIGASTDLYRDYDNKILPLPIVNYDSSTFYFRGLGGGYYLFKGPNDRLSVDLYYLPLQFKPSDANNWRMKQLDKRKSTAMAGVSYRHTESWGIIKASLSADILDNNEGFLGDIAYLYPLELNRTTITAGIGATWASEDYNRYYFGISGHESTRSGLARYKPDDSWSPYLEMNVNHNINSSWSVSLNGRVTRLSDEIKDSPMVDSDYLATGFVGVHYQF